MFELRANFPFTAAWRNLDALAERIVGQPAVHTGTNVCTGRRYLAWEFEDLAAAVDMRRELDADGFAPTVQEQ